VKAAALLSFVLAGAWTGPAVPASTGSEQGAARRIETAIAEEVALGFSGAVLVAEGNRVLVDGVHGAMRGNALPDRGRFLIASAAKQFTSAAIARLQDQGRLDIDDPIGRHLRDVPADKAAITIRQLLSHTSGLPQGHGSENAADRHEAERAILGVELSAVPGAKFQYSNENYQLGVAIVEAVSGRRYAEFVREELLRPAGLGDTGQLDGAAAVARLSPLAGPLPPRLADLRWGGFGYYTTARDFHRWYRVLRSGSLLRPGSVAELFSPATKIGEGNAALGWFVGATARGVETVFTRGNDDIGSSAVLYAYPASDYVIVVLSHAGQKTDELSWARAVHARIEEILFGAPGK
jgi:CubicO group peptidase (beta-lactamase class C family)